MPLCHYFLEIRRILDGPARPLVSPLTLPYPLPRLAGVPTPSRASHVHPTPPRPRVAVVAPSSGLSISFTPQLTSERPGGAPEPATVPAKPQVPKEDMDQKPAGRTKMDKDVLARTVQQLRSGVIHKQVASRREFRGCPFNSKPKLIHFKVSPGSSPGAEGTRPGLT